VLAIDWSPSVARLDYEHDQEHERDIDSLTPARLAPPSPSQPPVRANLC
jgi:hypothetical protein